MISAGRHRCRVTEVYDGDTVTVDIFLKSKTEELGFGVELTTRLVLRGWKMRLCDVDAKELTDFGGIEARDFVRDKILGRLVTGDFHLVNGDEEEQGKYGRWIAEITYKGQSINLALIEEGHGIYKKY